MSNQVYDKSDSSNDEDDESPVEVQSEQLIQCQACGRRMRPSVFAKHPNLCRENPAKKRLVNVFDMTRYRAVKAGDKTIPVAQLTSINSHQGSPTHLNNQSNSNIRPSQTRSAKRDRRPDAVVPPIINKFCCPMCKRTFCDKAYDRHVAFCASKMKQVQQGPSEETLLARLKLDRRVKFTANRLTNTSPMTTKPTIPTKTCSTRDDVCSVPVRKKYVDALARCPWCSKPYLPNCIHYCRNSKECFRIDSR